MRIGELARRLGVSRDSLRRLEAKGILKPARDWAGHRRFSEEDIARIEALLFPKRSASSDGQRVNKGQP